MGKFIFAWIDLQSSQALIQALKGGDADAFKEILGAPLSVTNKEKFPMSSHAWPMVISNLKSLLETGAIVLTDPYSIQSAHSKRK